MFYSKDIIQGAQIVSILRQRQARVKDMKWRMNKCLITAIAISFLQIAHTQDFIYQNSSRYADSLKSTFQAKKDKLALLALCYYYIEGDNDSCLAYARQLYDLSVMDNSKQFEALGLFYLGVAQEKRGNTGNDLQYALRALSIFQDLNDSVGVALEYWRLAVIYLSHEEDTSTVLDYFRKSLNAVPRNLHLNHKNYAWYLDGAFIKSINYWLLSKFYFDRNQPNSAFFYVKEYKKVLQDIPDKRYYSSVLGVVANYYQLQKNYALAMQYFKQSTDIAIIYGHLTQACTNYLGIAQILNETKGFDSSIFFARKAYFLSNTIKNYRNIYDVGVFLTNLFRQRGKIDSAFKYQGIMLRAKDSLMSPQKNKELEDVLFREQLRQVKIMENEARMQNRIKLYALLAGLAVLFIIAFILYRGNRHKQKAYTLLQKQKNEIDLQKAIAEKSLEELRTTQAQLIQSEKMASLGELTAGIAHEIQNPLNFVNNFSEVNEELLSEMNEQMANGNFGEAKALASNVIQNQEKIKQHGKRADTIVKNMLQHSRERSGTMELVDINDICNEYLRLAYHGLRAKDKTFNAKFETSLADDIGKINVVPQDIGRVLLNLINNAFYAVTEKKQQLDGDYEPCVSITTKKLPGKVEIVVKDNGNGIPEKLRDKIFQPFFTTKPAGQGTGLGLSLAYDIVKAHGGEIKVESKETEGSEFIIQLQGISAYSAEAWI